jgi:hypothetical protein
VCADRIGDASTHDGARESPHGEARRTRWVGDRQRKEHHSARPGKNGALKQLPRSGRRAGPSGLGPAVQRSNETRQHGVNLVSQRSQLGERDDAINPPAKLGEHTPKHVDRATPSVASVVQHDHRPWPSVRQDVRRGDASHG